MNKKLFHYRILKLVARISAFRKEHLSDNAFILILCVLAGVVTGFGAFILKFLIGSISRLCWGYPSPYTYHIRFLFLPLLGFILTVLYTRFIIREDLEQGVSKIRTALSRRKYNLKPNIIWGSMIGSSLTLGFGGSAGAEGPIAYTGAAIGSNIGRIFRLDKKDIRNLLAIGAGAGIAAIFKSPVGGVLFTLEVLQLEMTTFAVLSLVMACISASATCLACTGYVPDIHFHYTLPYDPSLLPWTLVLGIACGFYSIYYSRLQSRAGCMFKRIRNINVKVAIAGISTSLLVALIPALYGEGYNVITDMVNGSDTLILGNSPFMQFSGEKWILPVIIVFILAIKSYLVAAANCGGGVAGDFAPTLYAGALMGFLFAIVVNLVFPTNLPAAHFALLGMAAVMAGTIHAPLMAIFITVEMSSSYGFFFPIVITAILSYTVVKLVDPDSSYRTGRHDDLQAFAKRRDKFRI